MRRRNVNILLTGTASDSHTWNLVYLQLFLEELGHRVHNLGPCVPDDLLAGVCADRDPDLVVVSSVNGHGYRDGLGAVRALRARGLTVPVVIGGKLGVAGEADPRQRGRLLDAGFDAVFDDGDVGRLRSYLGSLPRARVRAGAGAGAMAGFAAGADAKAGAEAGAKAGVMAGARGRAVA
ncbi:cobalamin B12-binding domain-containing protein [Streptomyces sp. NPDC053429]|uniref:cobalamin B12-binding domain-containing protein n=1 Tax=Streptomyces sp. NPDC053429 TaxID=3365702 RepID=UPI0037CF41CA